MAQPDDHPSAGGLLHHLLTLTPQTVRRLFSSAFTYRRRQLLLSEVERPMLPGLSSRVSKDASGRAGTLLSNYKDNTKEANKQKKVNKFLSF